MSLAAPALAIALEALERGFQPGPPQQSFASTAARDTYTTANPSWISQYDNNSNYYIFVGPANNTQVFVRRAGAWADITNIALRGEKGDQGDPGPATPLPALATQAEAEAGTETNQRMWSPLRFAQGARAAISRRVQSFAQVGNTDRIPQAKTFGGNLVDLQSVTRTGQAIVFSFSRADGSTDTDTISGRMIVEAFEALAANQRLDIDSGTQGDLPATRVSGITQRTDAEVEELARDAVGAALVEGANITITTNDAANTITIAATGGQGGGGGITEEEARDAIAAALRGTLPVTVTHDDAANTITIAINNATTTAAGAMSATDKSKLDGLIQDPDYSAATDGTTGTRKVRTSAANISTIVDRAQTKSDWDETDSANAAYIQNKPTIPTQPTAEELRTTIGAPTTTNSGLAPSLPATNQADHFLRGDGTWDEVDYSDLTNAPTIPTLPDASQTRTLLGLPSPTSGTTRYLREDNTWQAVAWAAITGKPAIPTLRSRTETVTLIGNASATQSGLLPQLSGTATEFLSGDGTWRTPAGGSGGTGTPWPDAVHTSLAADVTLPTSATADTYGAWTETYRLTNSASEERKYLFFADLLCVASWWPGADGGDRGGAEFRVRIFNSSDVQQRELIHELPAYVRTGSSAFDTLSHYDVAALSLAFELQGNEYMLIEGRGISQKAGTGRSIMVSSSLSNIDYVDVTSVGGGGSGGTGLTTVSRDATLTGDGTSGSPLSVANPFSATDEARLDALTDAYLDERARDAVGTALTEGAGIDITVDDNADTITVAAETASDTNAGIAELATAAEALTGTDGDRAVTPLALAGLRPNADPLQDGTAARGNTNRFADQAHVHPAHPDTHAHSHTSTHSRRAAASADTTFVAADFTSTSTTDSIVIPTFTANSYIALAIPTTEDDLTFIRNPGGINQLQAFTKQAGTLTIDGATYKWWRSNRRFLVASSGATLEFGS